MQVLIPCPNREIKGIGVGLIVSFQYFNMNKKDFSLYVCIVNLCMLSPEHVVTRKLRDDSICEIW